MYEITIKCDSYEEATQVLIAHQAMRKTQPGNVGHHHHDHAQIAQQPTGPVYGVQTGPAPQPQYQPQPQPQYQPQPQPQYQPQPQPQYQPQGAGQPGQQYNTWGEVLGLQQQLVAQGKLTPQQVFPVLQKHGASVQAPPSPDRFPLIVAELKQLAGVQ